MKRHYLAASILVVTSLLSHGQNIRWAHQITSFSSQFGEKEFAATQVLKKPNAMPQGGKNSCAWLPEKQNSSSQYIEVAFNDPIQIKQVAIFENVNPGSIKMVSLINERGKAIKVFKTQPKEVKGPTRILRVMVDITTYKVHGVKVVMDCSAVVGPNQIDAIGVSDSEIPIEAKINIVPDIIFASEPENLGTNINSEYAEIHPIISPDGKGLYFNRKDHPENIEGDTPNDDIWYAEIDDQGSWNPAINMGAPINNANHNFVNGVTPDGNSMLLAYQYFEDGTFAEGASMAYKEKEGWSFPENLTIANFTNYSDYVGYSLSNDRQAIIMSIENYVSFGGRDIYVSFLIEGSNWSEPKNLGPMVNSSSDDITPFLASDGVTLYFSTDGRSTFGSNDIFMVKRLDDTWVNWSEPVNLGDGINTNSWDAYYTITASGDYGYFSSTKNSLGQDDIFRIQLPKEIKPDPVVLISGKVFNKKTNEPLQATIIYEVLPDGVEAGRAASDPGTGAYKIVLPYGKEYGIRAIAKGYYPISENLDVSTLSEYTELEKDLSLVPIEVGQVVRLNNIFFEFGKAALKAASFPELNRVVSFMKENQKVKIQISGHTDNIGSERTNLFLSQIRAESVMSFLIEKGVAKDRIIAKGYGEQNPIASNASEDGRALNRRVEFKIIE